MSTKKLKKSNLTKKISSKKISKPSKLKVKTDIKLKKPTLTKNIKKSSKKKSLKKSSKTKILEDNLKKSSKNNLKKSNKNVKNKIKNPTKDKIIIKIKKDKSSNKNTQNTQKALDYRSGVSDYDIRSKSKTIRAYIDRKYSIKDPRFETLKDLNWGFGIEHEVHFFHLPVLPKNNPRRISSKFRFESGT